jgi:PAS domain S-box-containing protein
MISSRSHAFRFLLPALATVVSVLLAASLGTSGRFVPVLLLLIVSASAWYQGSFSGLLSAGFSAVGVEYILYQAHASLPEQILATSGFLAVALLIIYLISRIHTGQQALANVKAGLEQHVEQRIGTLLAVNDALTRELAAHRQSAEELRNFQTENQRLFEGANDAILIFAPETQLILEANSRACEVYGFSHEQLVGMSMQQLSKDGESGRQQISAVLSHGGCRDFEMVQLKNDGTPISVVANASLVNYRGLRAILTINRDVTEIRRLEAERAQFVRDQAARAEIESAQRRITNILESITDGFMALDRQWRFMYVNREAEQSLGEKKEVLLGQNIWNKFPEAVGSTFYRHLDKSMSTQMANAFEAFYPPLRRWFELHAYPSVEGLSVYFRDVTDRHESEEALRLSEEAVRLSQQRLLMAQKTAQFSSWEWDLASGDMNWYEGSGAAYGIADGECHLTYANWLQRIHSEDREAVREAIAKAIEAGRDVDWEFRVIWPDTSVHWLTGRGQVFEDSSGKPVRMIGTSMDVTSRKRVEETVLELASIVESSSDAIVGVSLDGIIRTWNSGAEKIFGYVATEVRGKSYYMLMAASSPDDIQQNLEQIRHGERINNVETVRRTKSGELIHVSVTMSPLRNTAGSIVGFSTISRDITEKKRVEQILRLNEKLAATGRLAASIAHEINNPMATLSDIVFLLSREVQLDERGQSYLEIAEREVARISQITTQMLSLYRESSQPVPVRLSEVLEEALSLYARRIETENISVEFRNGVHGVVHAYPAEMRQLFSNLIANALDAAGRNGIVKVRVVHSRDWSNQDCLGIRVLVADNGVGIPPENRCKLFQPFFTTKGEKGTGLGLWVSHGIIQKHGGTVRVRSSSMPGRSGTCFSVFLPSIEPRIPTIVRDAKSRLAS